MDLIPRWNSSANNKWESSTLQKEVLNGVYWNSLGEYQSYIEQAKWYLGAPTHTSYTTYTTEQFYKEERSNTQGYSKGAISFIGNIGLLYPSDYGYSLENKYRIESIANNTNYINNAWLYNLESTFYEWTTSPESSINDSYAWVINPNGMVSGSFVYYALSIANNAWGIRPTFYLKSDVLYKNGTGSIDDPYQIGL